MRCLPRTGWERALKNVLQKRAGSHLEDSCQLKFLNQLFGGAIVQIKDQESLNSLAVMLHPFDRYKLGLAYWGLAETSRGPILVDGSGECSPLLTAILARIYPTSYTARNLAFFYNITP